MANVCSLSWLTLCCASVLASGARYRKVVHAAFAMRNAGRKAPSLTGLAIRDGKNPSELDLRFPGDYSELLEQAKVATEFALKDNKQLLEIEFPTAGLGSVPGDGEGGIEMTESMQLIREFVDRFVAPEKYTRTRIV